MILATYRRIETIPQKQLELLGRQVTAIWIAKGSPDFADMPAIWRHEHARVAREFARRGSQLRLF